MIHYKVTHKTTYKYEEPVSLCHNETHLIPRDLPYQERLGYEIEILPEPAVQQEREDFYGNTVSYFALQNNHKYLEVIARSEVQVSAPEPPDLKESPPWEVARDAILHDPDSGFMSVREFVFDSLRIYAFSDLEAYAQVSFTPNRPLLEATMDLTSRIHKDFKFDPEATNVSTPLETILKKRRGVCQDFAHLAIGCLRSLGLAARYISGYLETLPPPGQPKLVGADVSHAWVSVFCPEQGWIDFDPTNNQIPTSQYITLAWGRDYSDVSPLKGIIFGGGKKNTLSVSVDVERQSTETPPHTNEAAAR